MEEKNRGLGQAVPAQTAGLNERLSQLPPARDPGGVTVPSRQTPQDIDESAFGFEEEIAARTNPAAQHHAQAVAASRPSPIPARPASPPSQTMQPIRPDITPPASAFPPPTSPAPTAAPGPQLPPASPPAASPQPAAQPVSMSIGQVRAGDMNTTYGPPASHIPEEYAARISEKTAKEFC